MKELKKLLSVIWQLPQNIIGAIIYPFIKGDTYRPRCGFIRVYPNKINDPNDYIDIDTTRLNIKLSHKFNKGFACGEWVIIPAWVRDFPIINQINKLDQVIAHEYGHVKQSRILGPLYFIVGLSSMLNNSMGIDSERYYKWWTEKWADKLGGVKRYGN